MTTLTDPDAFATTFAYDSTAHRVDSVSEADGGTETISPVQVQGMSTGGTPAATLTAAVTADYTDGNSHTTHQRVDWNGFGQSMQATDAVGDVSVQYRYADGLVWVDSDGLGRRTVDHYTSDGAGMPVYDVGPNASRVVLPDDTHDDYTYNGLSEVLTAANGAAETTTYTYDASGNLLTVTDALNEVTTMGYDGRGNLTQSVSPRALAGYPEAQANTYTTNAQAAPKVAADANGDYVVVWQSNGQDGAGYGDLRPAVQQLRPGPGRRVPGQHPHDRTIRCSRRWRWTRPATSPSPGRATTTRTAAATGFMPGCSTRPGRPKRARSRSTLTPPASKPTRRWRWTRPATSSSPG